jgi:hypothetical protein
LILRTVESFFIGAGHEFPVSVSYSLSWFESLSVFTRSMLFLLFRTHIRLGLDINRDIQGADLFVLTKVWSTVEGCTLSAS